jgi:hypothetical protein
LWDVNFKYQTFFQGIGYKISKQTHKTISLPKNMKHFQILSRFFYLSTQILKDTKQSAVRIS